MANRWDDTEYDDQSEDQQPTGKDPVRAQLRKLEKENAQLKADLAKAQGVARKASIAEAIRSTDYDPKLAALVPADVEPSAEAVKAWLEQYGDLFAKPTATPPPEVPAEEPPEPDPQAQLMAQMGRIAAATTAAKAPVREADLLAKLNDPNLTRDALEKLIHAAGGGYGSG